MPMTMNEIRRVGIEALVTALGPDGMVRFLQHFDTGKGNYTKERDKWLENITMEELTKELKNFEKGSNSK